MPSARFRFHGALNDFLPAHRRGEWLERRFEGTPGLVDSIQALGVPHPEVDAILVGGKAAGLADRLHDGDFVEVFGLGGRSDDGPAAATGFAPAHSPAHYPAVHPGLVPAPPDPRRFVLDGHLGRLARHLRMLGFDTLYDGRAIDEELARMSAANERILLTRDRGLLKRSIVRLGYLVRSDDPRRQLDEVVARYDLATHALPFTRCIRCNGLIRPLPKADVLEPLAGEPRTLRFFDTFGQCGACGAIYWPGSHFDRMSGMVRAALGRDVAVGMGENLADAGRPAGSAEDGQ